MMFFGLGVRRKRQAILLSPIQLAWRRTWKNRVRMGLRGIGIGFGGLVLFFIAWAYFIVALSF